ncbi:nucleotide-diphospho-sugar transferase [Blyttiomyces helicus]|uniref:glycogenin glucosyltransferase n=1 Tax=Blyttiomyces helicus TaxID=388810 RepID=A0A4P9WL04_9FUNG|nr:nucleotide-diphospho-sugar transferase [Blyttiomyces helicus]|eukprot:RKO93072.1 nucleotide-diphospho-sugar transferase [Blyttiomyces helicus]
MRCFATLLTTDSYLPGALTLARSLRATETSHSLLVVVTDRVSPEARDALSRAFDRIVEVPVVDIGDAGNLALLGRLELGETGTKLHVWNPDVVGADVERLVFLDADTLVLQNVDSLFGFLDGGAEFAAAPDVGWPDCFNSGVFVCRPGAEIFAALMEHLLTVGSFDGGDQGLLNSFFSTWSTGAPCPTATSPFRPTARLPFTFNVTPSAFYSYLPAFARFHTDISIVHFIGSLKPWNMERGWDGGVAKR